MLRASAKAATFHFSDPPVDSNIDSSLFYPIAPQKSLEFVDFTESFPQSRWIWTICLLRGPWPRRSLV